ncbi:MAG: hypothetical protein H0T53_16820 [Herpetosiphonaceae bacterium]|nr:hypothetical protein [Herpetosiphonaceae bacterium]
MSGFFICPHCEAKVPASARACPECGSDEQTGWSSGPAAGGVFPASDHPDDLEWRRERRSALAGWMKVVLIGMVVILVFGTASKTNYREIIMLPLILLVVGVGYLAFRQRPALNLGLGREQALYATLLEQARGDQGLAERLIAYEQRRQPGATRQQAIQNAIYRWERDNG